MLIQLFTLWLHSPWSSAQVQLLHVKTNKKKSFIVHQMSQLVILAAIIQVTQGSSTFRNPLFVDGQPCDSGQGTLVLGLSHWEVREHFCIERIFMLWISQAPQTDNYYYSLGKELERAGVERIQATYALLYKPINRALPDLFSLLKMNLLLSKKDIKAQGTTNTTAVHQHSHCSWWELDDPCSAAGASPQIKCKNQWSRIISWS